MSQSLTVAAAQYPLDAFAAPEAYAAKLERWVKEAVGQGAELLVFPEYGAMELAALDGREAGLDLERSIDAVSTRLPFPAGGVVALGEMNKPQWVTARLDLTLLKSVRAGGGVQTYRHWTEQPGAGALPKAKLVDLTGTSAEAAA